MAPKRASSCRFASFLSLSLCFSAELSGERSVYRGEERTLTPVNRESSVLRIFALSLPIFPFKFVAFGRSDPLRLRPFEVSAANGFTPLFYFSQNLCRKKIRLRLCLSPFLSFTHTHTLFSLSLSHTHTHTHTISLSLSISLSL